MKQRDIKVGHVVECWIESTEYTNWRGTRGLSYGYPSTQNDDEFGHNTLLTIIAIIGEPIERFLTLEIGYVILFGCPRFDGLNTKYYEYNVIER